MIFQNKDFFSIRDLGAEEILFILNTAETMKYILNQKNKNAPHLRGKSVILFFDEPNAREKLSYELAAQHLSANTVDITGTDNFSKGETLHNVGQIIDQMGADFIVLRHAAAGAPQFLAKNVRATILNAGDGINENPGQCLLDLMTIREQKGGIAGMKVAVIGDILHSRMGKSNIWALTKLGAQVSVAGPPTLIPSCLSTFGVKTFYDPRLAVADADVILTTRIRMEVQEKHSLPSLVEYKNLFRVDEALLSLAKQDAIVMHPGSVKRDVEIASSVIDSKQCIINDQIANSVAVKMAVFYVFSQIGGYLHARNH